MPKWESVLVTGFGHPENNSMLSVNSWSSKLPSDFFPPEICYCIYVYVCVCVSVVRMYLQAHVYVLSHFNRVQLCNPMDCSLPGFSVHGIFLTRILGWVAMSSSRGSSQPRDWTCISCISCIAGVSLPLSHQRSPHSYVYECLWIFWGYTLQFDNLILLEFSTLLFSCESLCKNL